MKKITVIVLALLIVIFVSMMSFALSRACSCSQNPPIDNSIPTVNQPLPNPTTPVNMNDSDVTGVSPSSKVTMVDYSRIMVNQLILKDGKYQVKGITDLPPGTRLIVILKANSDPSLVLKKSIEVQNGAFIAFFSPSSPHFNGSQQFQVDVICDPQKQPCGSGSRIDRFGKNLVGEKVVIDGKIRMLKFSQLITLVS